ncbi:Ribosomal protein L11 methyltransferase [Thalassocella blandensis]|nr:Ribosomal protein L11 methyltransferase [Thalassocella blandensis]
MSWLQLHINTTPENAPAAEQAMQKHGALSITLADNADQPIFEPELGETPLWNETRVTGLFNAGINTRETLEKILASCSDEEAACQWQILEDKDWEREWMSHYHPIQCGENFWICPSWTAPPAPDAINLLLDPGLAFGTGTHPTTFMCLQWIATQQFHNSYVIDYGCGSGILGIAALLHGADKVIGTDIDPQALLATRENVKRNHLESDIFPVYFPNKCPEQKADFVLANILAGPLVELAPTLCALLKPQGKICLSGILKTQEEAIVKAYEAYIDIDNIHQDDQWICVTGHAR